MKKDILWMLGTVIAALTVALLITMGMGSLRQSPSPCGEKSIEENPGIYVEPFGLDEWTLTSMVPAAFAEDARKLVHQIKRLYGKYLEREEAPKHSEECITDPCEFAVEGIDTLMVGFEDYDEVKRCEVVFNTVFSRCFNHGADHGWGVKDFVTCVECTYEAWIQHCCDCPDPSLATACCPRCVHVDIGVVEEE